MSIITKVFAWVRALFNQIPKEIRIYASQALDITTRIKVILDNPVADIITAIIPGDWDDKAKELALKYINEAIPYLTIVDECQNDDPEKMIRCWIEKLGQYKPDVQKALLFQLAMLLTAKFDNDELKHSFYALAVQANFAHGKIEE